MNRPAFVLALVMALSGAGCATTPPELKPNGKVTITVDAAVRPTRATAKLGNEIVIVLPPPDPAGYRWQIAQHNANILKQLTEIVPGGPAGESTISFMAIRSGGTRLLFALVPANAGNEVEPAGVQEIQVFIE